VARLSVVVGTLNRLEQLRRCLDSIVAETTVSVRVYVSDAGSSDGTVKYLEAVASDRIVPVFAGQRQGQARAYNEVFAQVDTPYVCWLSDDNVIVNGALDVAVGILDTTPTIGMVGLKVKDVRGPFSDAPYIGGISVIGILNVNQGVVRTPILHAIGGFSEAFRDYGIDPDLTAKVLFSGHAVAYTRVIGIHHYRNWADPTSPEYARHMDRQRAYLDLYLRKYAAQTPSGVAWPARRLLAKAVRGLLALWPGRHSTRAILGLTPRDWANVIGSRYISLLDGWRSRGKPYHLTQWCPPRSRPSTLPADLQS
jgi:GT2 family glycosyltransferase